MSDPFNEVIGLRPGKEEEEREQKRYSLIVMKGESVRRSLFPSFPSQVLPYTLNT